MKLRSLTAKKVAEFWGLTRTGTAREPGAVGQNSEPMGPPDALYNVPPSADLGGPSPSAPCENTAIQGYYALGHEQAKRIRQHGASGHPCAWASPSHTKQGSVSSM